MQRAPNHPGKIFDKEVLVYYNLSIEEAAERLGVDSCFLSEFINGRAEMNCDLAVRIAKLLGSSAQMWMNMQLNYFNFLNEAHIHVEPLFRDIADCNL